MDVLPKAQSHQNKFKSC